MWKLQEDVYIWSHLLISTAVNALHGRDGTVSCSCQAWDGMVCNCIHFLCKCSHTRPRGHVRTSTPLVELILFLNWSNQQVNPGWCTFTVFSEKKNPPHCKTNLSLHRVRVLHGYLNSLVHYVPISALLRPVTACRKHNHMSGLFRNALGGPAELESVSSILLVRVDKVG